MANDLIRNLFSFIQKRFLQSSSPHSSVPPLTDSTSPSSSFTVQFLVNSCKIPLQSALSLTKKFQLNEKKHRNTQAVLHLLRSHNFNDTLLAALIVKFPKILCCRVESNLHPKFEYLRENGLEGELLPQIIISNPGIVFKSLDSQIKSSFEFLRSVLDSDEKVLGAIKRTPWLLTTNLKNALRPVIDFLLKEGVPVDLVAKLLTCYPRCMLAIKVDRIASAVSSVRNLGFQSDDPMFIYALRVVIQMSDSTWKKKIEIMKSMGFIEMEILKAVRRCPFFLAYSEKKLRNKVDFYVNSIQLEPRTLIENPVLFTLSIEKRVRPRYNVLKILESNKLVENIKKINMLITSEKNFRKIYIDRFIDEIPGLLEAYRPINETKKIGA